MSLARESVETVCVAWLMRTELSGHKSKALSNTAFKMRLACDCTQSTSIAAAASFLFYPYIILLIVLFPDCHTVSLQSCQSDYSHDTVRLQS